MTTEVCSGFSARLTYPRGLEQEMVGNQSEGQQTDVQTLWLVPSLFQPFGSAPSVPPSDLLQSVPLFPDQAEAFWDFFAPVLHPSLAKP